MPTQPIVEVECRLTANAYGKSRVRLVKVTRRQHHHEVREMSVNILFEGSFESCYRIGDNSLILPTDTMKNTVYALARGSEASAPEAFAQELAAHFLAGNPPVSRVRIEITESIWERIGESAAAFRKTGPETRTSLVTATRDAVQVTSGLDNLTVLKTTDSAFEGFFKDALTTLREASDRLFGTAIRASWHYDTIPPDYDAQWRSIRETILESFAAHKSLSVQHTLFAVGEAVIAAYPEISEIELAMPNKHCLLVDMTPFGQENPNEIFVPTDEPHGYIEARVRRGA